MESAATPAVTLETLAADPTVVVQGFSRELAEESASVNPIPPAPAPSAPPSAALESASVESSATPAVTLETLVADPTVVVQGFSSSITSTAPSIVASRGTERRFSRPAVGRAALTSEQTVIAEPLPDSSPSAVLSAQSISNAGAGGARLVRTLEELMNDPTVVVQRLPGIGSTVEASTRTNLDAETSSFNPARSEVAISEQISLLEPETGSELHVWNSVVPRLDYNDITLRISNGTGRNNLAQRFAGFISERGFIPDSITNAPSFDYKNSYVFYNPGLLSAAEQIAEMIPMPVKLVEATKGLGHVEVVLGSDIHVFDDRL